MELRRVILEFLKLKCIEIGVFSLTALKYIGYMLGLFTFIGGVVLFSIWIENHPIYLKVLQYSLLTILMLYMVALMAEILHYFNKWIKSNWNQAKRNVRKKNET